MRVEFDTVRLTRELLSDTSKVIWNMNGGGKKLDRLSGLKLLNCGAQFTYSVITPLLKTQQVHVIHQSYYRCRSCSAVANLDDVLTLSGTVLDNRWVKHKQK